VKKRRSSIEPGQLGFTFDPPAPAVRDADLAGFGAVIAACVGRALKDDPRSRDEIAGAMSALLAEPVTRCMLDAYASEARDQHNISACRFHALIAVTRRFDLLDLVARRIGAAVLVGEEIVTAELGHIDRQIADLKARKRRLETGARPIVRSERG
jgi:hypothetical protein